jgi:putative hydrolase of the HAD superfamily
MGEGGAEDAKALVLDFGGVISRTLFETHARTEAALGLPPGALTWRGPFAPETDRPWRDMQAGKISERDYWRLRARETAALIGADWKDMADFVRAARGADPDAILRPEAVDAIARAKRGGARLAILSNELDLFYGADFRARLPILRQFDVIVDATHTGVLKPDPRAFAQVCEALALPPAACVFLDDQRRNADGARAAGMIAVHVDVTRPQDAFARALALLGLTGDSER